MKENQQGKRRFEILSDWKDKINNEFLPKRETYKSAGYDIKCAEDIVIPTIWSQLSLFNSSIGIRNRVADEKIFRATMVSTGLTAFFLDDEVLKLHVRSSIGFKWLSTLANSVGIVDADYSDKGGHIMIPMINFGFKDRTVKKGEAIAQGIFHKFLITDDDNPEERERVSGFGHTSGEGLNK
jgi:dUTP pyrophosphatase